MKRRHGDAFIFKAYYFKKQFVAFSTNIAYENSTREIHFIGLDYAYNESHCLYFNILFDGLEMAIAANATKLELGRTARVAKASLGALPLEVHNYIFLRKGLPSLAFSFFNNWFIKNFVSQYCLGKETLLSSCLIPLADCGNRMGIFLLKELFLNG